MTVSACGKGDGPNLGDCLSMNGPESIIPLTSTQVAI